MVEIQSIIRELTHSCVAGRVLATLVSVEGSSYRRPGARLLLKPDRTRIGSISGGCLEEDLIARALQVAENGEATLVTYDTTLENDLVWGVGLGCHGVVKILLERLPSRPLWAERLAENFLHCRPTSLRVIWAATDINRLGTSLAAPETKLPAGTSAFDENLLPPVRLAIFGAGDDAQPLAKMAKDVGWHVSVADPRAEFVTLARFPSADALVVAPAAELVARTNPPADSLAVVMTHRYVQDVPILRGLCNRPLAYLGLLGPKKRADQIILELRADGPSTGLDRLAQLHAPVGLDLGAETPEEVALSIVAEMRATLANRDGRPLRERKRPIHG